MPSLANLTNFDDFLNGSARQFNFDPTEMSEGADILAQLNGLGANARFINTGPQGDAGNSMWQLDYDRSKLPPPPSLQSNTPGIGGKDIAFLNPHMNYARNEGGENGGAATFANYEQQSRSDSEGLFNPGLVRNDDTYGRYTPSVNVKPEERDWKDTAWTMAPAAIMALASLGTMAGPAAGMAAAGAGAAGAGASTFAGLSAQQLASLFQSVMGQAQNVSRGGDFDALGTGMSLGRLALGRLGGG
jgi:hypothetical protein